MDLICPECRGEVVAATAATAKCRTHGGIFRILFLRGAPSAVPAAAGEAGATIRLAAPRPQPPPLPPSIAAASRGVPAATGEVGATVRMAAPQQRPSAPVPVAAVSTGTPATSDEPGVTVRLAAPAAPVAPRAAVPRSGPAACPRHPAVMTALRCTRCGNPVCGTCAQSAPDGATICPDCGRGSVLAQPAPMAPAMPVTPVAPVVRRAPAPRTGPAACPRHPAVMTALRCSRCASPVCGTCAETNPDGSTLCPDCGRGSVLGLSGGSARATPVILGQCARHPEMPATQRCASCQTLVCETCDFAFAGDLHLCPTCATNPRQPISGTRKRNALWAYGLAAWSTLSLPLLMLVSAGMSSKSDQEAVGVLFMLFGFVPCVVGCALGFGAVDRRRSNPFWIWGGALWNGLVLACFLLLMVVGAFMS